MNIILENTETSKSLNLGRLTMEMIKILEEAGFSFGTEPGDTVIREAWSLEIKEETKDKLSKLAMRMSRPIRDQRKTTSEQAATEPDKVPDLFDLIFG